MRALVLLVAIATWAACAASPRPHARFPDAPLQLLDDADRDQAIDQLWSLPRGPGRDALRAEIAAAITRRLTDAIAGEQQLAAEELLFQLASLWRDDPQAVGTGLAAYTPVIVRLRAMFAKSGALEPTVESLALLVELDPAHRTRHLAELDEVLAFADELAVAEHGAGAERGQPILLLHPTAVALPLPWVVDRYVALLEARQAAVGAQIAKAGGVPTIEILRAHPDYMHTAHRVANALARAGRADEIAAHLAKLSGPFGTDRALTTLAEDVAVAPKPAAYFELARALRDDKGAADGDAALGVSMRGLQRFPRDASLYGIAGEDAAALGRIDQPIALDEAALDADGSGEVDTMLALRLGKLYAERISRLALGGRPAAAIEAWRELAHYTDGAAKRTPSDVWHQVAAIGESALGRGLLSQARLGEAEVALAGSVRRAPSVDAYEALATIAIKTDRLPLAVSYVARGLGLLGGGTTGDRYHDAKLRRLAGDIARAAGRPSDAGDLYRQSLLAWASLGDDKHLPRAIAAERKLERGRVQWFIGDPTQAIELVQEAVDLDPDSASTCTTAVAFLIEVGRTDVALDTLHRTLGSPDIGELYKVYASLWALGDARWHGAPRDPIAEEYLASRHGDLWYEQLAEAATGRLDYARLAAAASTGARRAELAYYGAVLGLDPAAATGPGARARLREVVSAGLVMDAEYDLARQYLAAPRPRRAATRTP
jgi:tetratricopeptide (TPR) repeat protein